MIRGDPMMMLKNGVSNGTLYKCMATDTGAAYYTPYP